MRSCKKAHGFFSEMVPTRYRFSNNNASNASRYGWLRYDTYLSNVIAQMSAKVVMASRFLGFVCSLSSSEQQLWFPNQNVQDPDTWTLPHVLQLKQEYKKLVENFNCDIQEFVMVQEDPPALPSDTLHLPPLHCLHSATTRNMELPQPGELRKVQPPSQRSISRQLMKS